MAQIKAKLEGHPAVLGVCSVQEPHKAIKLEKVQMQPPSSPEPLRGESASYGGPKGRKSRV